MNKGKICVSVCAETAAEFIEAIKRAEEFADVIELRFDCLDEKEFDLALQKVSVMSCKKPFLATFRPKHKKAVFVLVKIIFENEEEKQLVEKAVSYRIQGWKRISELSNVGLIDLEADIHKLFDKSGEFWDARRESTISITFDEKLKKRKIIISEHNFENSPEKLSEIYDDLSTDYSDETGELKDGQFFVPDIVKIAVQANEITDSIPIWKLLERAKKDDKPVIPIAMGEAGKWTRILGSAHGAFMTYAALEEGNETAPGQISAQDLIEIYRVKELDEQTEIYGVLGNPVSHSLSPFIHNTAFKFHNLNAVFIPFEVKNLDEFIEKFVRAETREIELYFKGFSVTIPHKKTIIKHLDFIDETAQTIGAVNTVKIVDGKLHGFNTDAQGFIEPLQNSYGDLRGVRVAVLGNGGAARACVYALKKEYAEVTMFGRNIEKAKDLADEFQVSYQELQITKDKDKKLLFEHFDILVNTTPLGTKGDLENETPVLSEQLKNLKLVYDLVYNPFETRLIKEARNANVPTLGGLAMLIGQAKLQFEIWTGKDAPLKEIGAAALKRLK